MTNAMSSSVTIRWLMTRGLRASLEKAETPVILDLCGVGGIKAGEIHWDDLQFERGYRAFKATMQGARAAELLATALFAKPVREAIPPMVELIDHPPAAPLSAYVRGRPVTLTADRRLDEAVRALAGRF